MFRFTISALALGLIAGCATPGKVAETVELRVLTYNIHHGEGTDGKLDLERIAAIIRASQADLVALQEVDQNTTRAQGVDQAAELGRLTGLHHVFGQAMPYQGGGYGQAVLSKWPIEAHEVRQLPQRTNREPRIALITRIRGPVKNLTFASTHLDHQLEDVRVEQARALNQILATREPALLLGDFNATPSSATMKLVLDEFADAAGPQAQPTIPAGAPTRRIDYILLRPPGQWQSAGAQVLAEPVASDHRPVAATLRFFGR